MQRILAALSVLVCLAAAAPLWADAPQTSVVSGTVRALGGDALPGVEVRLEGERGVKTATTDAAGSFRFPAVISGSYTVSAGMQGLQTRAQSIVVEPGVPVEVDLELGAELEDEIVVRGETPLISKYEVSSGGTIANAELEAITGDARQYRSHLQMLPGVYNDDSSKTGNRPSIQGTEGARQVYFVDGVDVSFARWGGGSQLNIPAGAIEQLSLKSTGADAEYSRTVGAYTTAIVKSGTNVYHGSAQWMVQNLSWNAENDRVSEQRPDQTYDSWDGAIGGRIVRDRLWFFAAAKRDDNPAYSVMADGVSIVDVGSVQESRLLKVDAQPSQSHALAVTWVETPWSFPWWNDATFGDLETVASFSYPGDLLSGRWSWTASNNVLVEANAGTTEPAQDRESLVGSNVDPGCAPNQPCGNGWVYRPFDGTALFYNGIGLPLGEGFTTFPRDQINGSVNWFSGDHDFKIGVDYQELAWELGGVSPPLCRGRGYSETAPGGFNSNVAGIVAWCRFFPTKAAWTQGYGPTSFEQDNGALYARDRFSVGDHWTFNLGLRLDDQNHYNDVGTEVLSSTDLMPRVNAVYDWFSNGRLLVSASAGRYVSHLEQEWSSNFNVLPSGRDQFEQYNWNRATGDYDIRTVVFTGVSGNAIVEVEPPYKDEATAGVEWQFHPNWALKVRGIYWERNGAPQILAQLDGTGTAVQQVEDTDSKTEHQALSFAVQRSYRNNWTVAASYDLSSTEGDCQYNDNGGCLYALGELDLWTENGVPVSEINRWGNLREDRPHMLKLRGAYRFDLPGRHSINLGGFFILHSGYPWNPVEERTIPDALDPQNTNQSVTVFLEPRGSRRTPTQHQLNLNAGWDFPVAKQLSGELRAEILNVTDEQELIGVAGLPTTGEALLQSGNFQDPRRVRVMATFRF